MQKQVALYTIIYNTDFTMTLLVFFSTHVHIHIYTYEHPQVHTHEHAQIIKISSFLPWENLTPAGNLMFISIEKDPEKGLVFSFE